MLFLLYESNVRIRVVPGMISGEWMSQYRIFGPGLKIIGCSSLFDGRTKVAVPDPDLIMINNKGSRKIFFLQVGPLRVGGVKAGPVRKNNFFEAWKKKS